MKNKHKKISVLILALVVWCFGAHYLLDGNSEDDLIMAACSMSFVLTMLYFLSVIDSREKYNPNKIYDKE